MKEIYIIDILQQGKINSTIIIQGWIKAKRNQGKIIFLDFCDSTGDIQVSANQTDVTNKLFKTIKHTPPP